MEVRAEVEMEAVEASFNQVQDNRKDSNNSSNHLQATITNADIVWRMGIYRKFVQNVSQLEPPRSTRTGSPMLKLVQLTAKLDNNSNSSSSNSSSSLIALLNSKLGEVKMFSPPHPLNLSTRVAITCPLPMIKLGTFCHKIFRTR